MISSRGTIAATARCAGISLASLAAPSVSTANLLHRCAAWLQQSHDGDRPTFLPSAQPGHVAAPQTRERGGSSLGAGERVVEPGVECLSDHRPHLCPRLTTQFGRQGEAACTDQGRTVEQQGDTPTDPRRSRSARMDRWPPRSLCRASCRNPSPEESRTKPSTRPWICATATRTACESDESCVHGSLAFIAVGTYVDERAGGLRDSSCPSGRSRRYRRSSASRTPKPISTTPVKRSRARRTRRSP